jgi:pyruvate kinase
MDGADAVMLSGETATGIVQVIEKMTQIIKAVENSPLIQVPQTHHKLKQNVSSLKQFVAMLQLWLMQSKQKQFVL